MTLSALPLAIALFGCNGGAPDAAPEAPPAPPPAEAPAAKSPAPSGNAAPQVVAVKGPSGPELAPGVVIRPKMTDGHPADDVGVTVLGGRPQIVRQRAAKGDTPCAIEAIALTPVAGGFAFDMDAALKGRMHTCTGKNCTACELTFTDEGAFDGCDCTQPVMDLGTPHCDHTVSEVLDFTTVVVQR